MKGGSGFQGKAKKQLVFAWLTCLVIGACLLFANLYRQYYAIQFLGYSFSQPGNSGERLDSGREVLSPEDHIFRRPKTISSTWVISSGLRAPDGVSKRVYLINGEFPGPTIQARSGDTLEIEVINNLEDGEGVSIHWHGLYMKGSNEMDGAVGFTQCHIPPSSNFTYRFHIDEHQAGTFWYHSHSREQSGDGLWGGLVIHRPADILNEKLHYGYDEELMLQIGDWYHHPADELLKKYLHWSSAGSEPAPDSILINGVGTFNCSMLRPNSGLECKPKPRQPILKLTAGRKYRLRIVAVGSLTGLTLSIPGSKLTLVQVDGGHPVDQVPATEAVGIIYPGQRVDLLVEVGDYAKIEKMPNLVVTLDEENFIIRNLALTPTQYFPIDLISPKVSVRNPRPYQINGPHPTHRPVFHSYYDLSNLTGPPAEPPAFPQKPDQNFVIYTMMEIDSINQNSPIGLINRTSWKPQSKPPLPLIALPRKDWDENQLVPWTGSNAQWVDIVVNNMDVSGHPFHLHGFSFYILSTCSLRYGPPHNPFSTAIPKCGAYNLINPPIRDTIYVPARGYVVLRFLADNEGIWLFHCHLLWHHAAGMAMAFQVMGSEDVGVFEGNGKRETAGRFCKV